MQDQTLFSYAFNCGALAMVEVLKDLDGPALKAATRAIGAVASERVQETAGLPEEDILTMLEPFVDAIKEKISGV
jgi:hypothetical protein